MTLAVSVGLSFWRPIWMIYFIILFDLYWLLRILYFLPFLLISWYRYRQALKMNWQSLAEQQTGYMEIRHLIFLPTYKEDLSVVEETMQSLSKCPYPSQNMMIVLAGEERDVERFSEIATVVKQKYAHYFAEFFVTTILKGA
jgi:cellulose synthase/poly-beta-1,6-N-acetylglucosamine synthase-like glycosyltransferase